MSQIAESYLSNLSEFSHMTTARARTNAHSVNMIHNPNGLMTTTAQGSLSACWYLIRCQKKRLLQGE